MTVEPHAQPLIAGKAATSDLPSAQSPDTVLSTWRHMEIVLSPVIGQRGVAALYRRSLFLARAQHPWLAQVPMNVLRSDDLSILCKALFNRPTDQVIAASDHMVQIFQGLLKKLIGDPLTQRLLALEPAPTHPPPATPLTQNSMP